MRIILVGFMGSGKSTLAKKLANKLSLKFIDLDELIVAKTGKSINDIFSIGGEDTFREIEQECLKESLLHDDIVVATGGGAPCFSNNMEIINGNGISVYIKLKSGLLTSRLFNAKSERPLLKNINNRNDLQKHVEVLLAFREPFYLKSALIVEGENINADKIIHLLKTNKFLQ